MRETEILEKIVMKSLKKLCEIDWILFRDKLSEQCICSKFAHYMSLEVENEISDVAYKVDTEYNRGFGGGKKVVSVKNNNEEYILRKILCDLVVHCRGEKIGGRENLIAIEMKKTTDCIRKVKNKGIDGERCNKREADFMRLIALTSAHENHAGFSHIEEYGVYDYPEAINRSLHIVEGFEIGFFIELIDKGDRIIPYGWKKNSITGLKITLFTDGREQKEKEYQIIFDADGDVINFGDF